MHSPPRVESTGLLAAGGPPPPSSLLHREGPGSEQLKAGYSRTRVIVFQVVFVLLSATLTLLWRWQATVLVDAHTGRKFGNPIGQAIASVIFFPLFELGRFAYVSWFFSKRQAATGEPMRRIPGLNCPTEEFGWLAAAPLGTLQAGVNICLGLSAGHIGATVIQVLRSSKLPFAALISFFILGKRYTSVKVTGIVVLVAGAIAIAVTTPREHGDTKSESLLMIGVIFFMSFLGAVRSVFEERVMDRYMATELDLVGKEGTIAFLICATFGVFCVACPNSWGMPDPLQFWRDMHASHVAVASAVLLAVLNPIKAAVGLGVTNLTSAVAMIVTGQLRVVVVAIPSALLLSEAFSPYQFVGYALLVLGLATYFGMGPISVLFRSTETTAATGDESARAAPGVDVASELLPIETSKSLLEA